MTKKIKGLLIYLLLVSQSVLTQNLSISGVVTDNIGNPLPGVSVVVEGTNRGVATDFDGNFTIEAEKGKYLIFSYIGFKNKRILLENTSNLSVVLEEDMQRLDEVVVIGYGAQKKNDVTGSVSIVDSETIEDLRPVNASLALQGTSSGVNVNTSSGAPGGKINILIRGVSSNGNNDPLVIIDGYEGNLNTINPEDIENITVLKDAQAAIYGIKGANGVVLVTTKTGKKNMEPKVNVSAYTGIQQTTKKLNYMNATEYAALLNESYATSGNPILITDISELGKGTDWQEQMFNNALIYNINTSISGGGERITYYAGASNLYQDGIVASEKSNFERSNVRLSLGIDITPSVKLSLNSNYSSNKRASIPENVLGSVLFNALNFSPTYGLDQKDANGFLGNEVINPLHQVANIHNSYRGNGLEGNFQVLYKIVDGLDFTSRLGYKVYSDKSKNFDPIVNHGPGKIFNRDRSSVVQSRTENKTYMWENFLVYKKIFWKDHTTIFTLGNSIQRNSGSGIFATGYDIPNNSWDFADISLATGIVNSKTNSSYVYDSRLSSVFGRFQYNYKERYLLSAMLRRDASSDFSKQNRADLFSSATVGWKLSEEKFLKNMSDIDLLKLRFSYGTLGSNTGRNLFKAILNGQATYVINGNLVNGTAMGVIPNANAKWEIAEKLDLGLDLDMYRNKLSLVFDYFIESRNDLLISNFPVSGIIGATAPGASNPTVNAGTTRNIGFELSVGYKNQLTEDLFFNTNFNFSRVTGEVVNINGDVIPEGGEFGVGQQPPSRMEVGMPIGYFYGFKTDGIFQNQAEVDAHPSQLALGAEARPGDIRYKDINGDGTININDRTYIGKPVATYYMGLNLSAKYKGFDFSSYFYAELDKEMVRNYERLQPNVNRHRMYLERWHGEGTSHTIPRVTTGATTNNVFSDFYVEDASFLRLQNIQLGFSIPEHYLRDVGLDNCRIFASVNNAFILTKYKGYDPSSSSGEAIGGGIDFGFYPQARQYLMGINIKF